MTLERLAPKLSPEQWRNYGHLHLQRYRFVMPWVGGRRVLDLACGSGYGSYALRTLGAREVVGVDLSEEAIRYAQTHYQRAGLRYEVGDAMTWTPGDGGFDAVISFETVEHLPEPGKFIERVAGHLNPGGIFIVSAPNILRYQKATPPRENPFHLNEPDYRDLCAWLEPWFEIEGEWEQSPVADRHGIDAMRGVLQLERLVTYRVLRKVENFLRGLVLRPSPASDPMLDPQEIVTDILPLLPERRAACDVFVFVCRRKA